MTEISVLNLDLSFYQSIHLLRKEIEPFDHWNEDEKLFLELDFLFFDEVLFELFDLSFSLANVDISLINDVLVVANK